MDNIRYCWMKRVSQPRIGRYSGGGWNSKKSCWLRGHDGRWKTKESSTLLFARPVVGRGRACKGGEQKDSWEPQLVSCRKAGEKGDGDSRGSRMAPGPDWEGGGGRDKGDGPGTRASKKLGGFQRAGTSDARDRKPGAKSRMQMMGSQQQWACGIKQK